MSKGPRYAILGGGNGGQSIAGDIASRGFEVSALYDRFPEAVEPVAERGGVELVGPVRSGFGKVGLVTSDIGKAVTAGDVLLVVVPGFAHEWMAENMAPHVRSGQIVVIVPGYTGSSLMFRKIWTRMGAAAGVVIAETSSLPYATRLVGPAQAGIKGAKIALEVAALPSTDTQRVIDALQPAFLAPRFEAADNVLGAGLNNINPMDHVPFYLFCLGRIEGDMPKGHFDWHDWMTPKIKLVAKTLDRERRDVAKSLGVRAYVKEELAFKWYAGEPWKIIQPTGAIPESSETVPGRYITEDVPHGLVPIANLGRALGVATPLTDSLITVASTIMGTDYWREGRTLAKLGLEGLTPDQIRASL